MVDIDFGHILGNFKSKAGIKRERAAFVFTPEMAFIVANKSRKMKNNENYQKFLDMCVKGYQLLREHSNSWMILHKLMVSAGIPELEQIEDIEYMLEILMESASPAQAEKRILSEIDKSVNTTWRLVDNLIHTWVHEA